MVELSVQDIEKSFIGSQAWPLCELTEPRVLRMSLALEEELHRAMAGPFPPRSHDSILGWAPYRGQ